jgi:hypothetical protein
LRAISRRKFEKIHNRNCKKFLFKNSERRGNLSIRDLGSEIPGIVEESCDNPKLKPQLGVRDRRSSSLSSANSNWVESIV